MITAMSLGISNPGRGGGRYRVYRNGAVKVNIAIMCAFVKPREALGTNRQLTFNELEKRVRNREEIGTIVEAIRQLIAKYEFPEREIGFHVRETAPRYRTRNVR